MLDNKNNYNNDATTAVAKTLEPHGVAPNNVQDKLIIDEAMESVNSKATKQLSTYFAFLRRQLKAKIYQAAILC